MRDLRAEEKVGAFEPPLLESAHRRASSPKLLSQQPPMAAVFHEHVTSELMLLPLFL